MDMKQINNRIKAIALIALILLPFNTILAGNPQRAGQSGASELLINPWGRTSGWAGANIAGVRGLEGIYSNVAGLAFTEKTELIFAQTSWLQYGSKMFNENDAVTTDDLKVGDNDNLSAMVAAAADADALMIFSDVDGLYDKNPNLHDDAVLLPEIKIISAEGIINL